MHTPNHPIADTNLLKMDLKSDMVGMRPKLIYTQVVPYYMKALSVPLAILLPLEHNNHLFQHLYLVVSDLIEATNAITAQAD